MFYQVIRRSCGILIFSILPSIYHGEMIALEDIIQYVLFFISLLCVMHVVNTSFVMLSVKVLLVSSRDNLTAFPFVFPQVHLIQVTLSIYIDSK